VRAEVPRVSVLIPCRNEGQYLAQCLASVVASDFPHDRLEVLVIDGDSTDQSPAIVDRVALRHPFVRRLANPRRITPAGLNIGIRACAGDIIIRLDAHAAIAPDYVSRCVDVLRTSGADNVGGIMRTRPRGAGRLARAIGAVTSHRFGVGGSYFRAHPSGPMWVDTVFGGCYPRAVFERVGLFNERLVRGQDMEFNQRLRRAGGRILLDPSIVCDYYARSSPTEFARHTWTNGVWAIVPFLHSPVMPVRARHLVPLGFVLSLVLAAVLGITTSVGPGPFLAISGSYGLGALLAAADVARRERDLMLAPPAVACFALLHLAYGLGSLWGLARVAWEWVRGARRPVPEDAWPRLTPRPAASQARVSAP
jgi:succinoglycan biosynthesis protein ExoA